MIKYNSLKVQPLFLVEKVKHESQPKLDGKYLLTKVVGLRVILQAILIALVDVFHFKGFSLLFYLLLFGMCYITTL